MTTDELLREARAIIRGQSARRYTPNPMTPAPGEDRELILIQIELLGRIVKLLESPGQSPH